MRLLLIEDNKRVAVALKDALKSTYVVDIYNTGKTALKNANFGQYDLILLDLNLPDMSGEDICRHIREQKIQVPIIIITGDGATESKVSVLDCGADDYVTKPFSTDELKARIRAAMRRHTPHHEAPATLTVDKLEIDLATRTVLRDGDEVYLRRKEFDLLEYMMHNSGRTLTRAMIIDHVWENGNNLWTNAVDVHIKYLRDKIDKPFGTQLIKTVHGVGYKLEVETEGEVANI